MADKDNAQEETGMFGNQDMMEVKDPTVEVAEDAGKEGGDKEMTPLEKEQAEKIENLEGKLGKYGENLTNQRGIIDKLSEQVKELTKDGDDVKEEDIEVPYPEIKYSKDLPEDEREEMTKREIEQMDMIAKMQENENKKTIEAVKAKVESDRKAEEGKYDVTENAKQFAMELAGDDREMANKIISEFNNFDSSKVDSDDSLKTMLDKASKLVDDFKPAKEETQKGGSAVKKEGDGSDFDATSIIKGVTSTNEGGYDL